ncbi:MAG: LPS assembly lipoprotein LptE [Pseudomonadota bacterium]
MRLQNKDIPAAFTLLLLMFATFLLSACGYTHPYAKMQSEGGTNKQNAVSIYVDMWDNQTSELGYQSEIKQALFRWLKKSSFITMAQSKEQADYILDGTVESAHYPGLSYGIWDRAVELRAEVLFSFKLTEKKTGKVSLQKGERKWHESFKASNDAATTEMNKREALQEIAEHIAENMYVQLSYRFSHKDQAGIELDFPDKKEISE